MADVVDHPLSDEEARQFGQAPGRKWQAMLSRSGLGDLLDLAALGQREGLRSATSVLGIEGGEAVGVEVVDHVADPVRAGEGDLGDLRHGHALRGQQHHLSPPPGHHRAGATADDPQHPSALIVVDLADAYSFCHPHSLMAAQAGEETRLRSRPETAFCSGHVPALTTPWCHSARRMQARGHRSRQCAASRSRIFRRPGVSLLSSMS